MYLKNLTQLRFAILKFRTKLLSDCILPAYKGSALRGGFGYNIQKIFCTVPAGKRYCPDCKSRNTCFYCYIFETPSSKEFKLLSKYPSVPHPFIIEPSLDDKTDYQRGDYLNFNLILLGKAIEYFPYFIYAFEETGRIGIGKGRQGKYFLEAVTELNFSGSNGDTVYDKSRNILKAPSNIIEFSEINNIIEKIGDVNKVTFQFLTPVRIKYRQNIVNYLEFHIFMRSFLRRLSSLCYFHCDEDLNLDYKGIIDKAKQVDMVKTGLCWKNSFKRSALRGGKIDFSGLKGSVTFKGDLKDFIIFILLGKYFHVGQIASFGLGRYEFTIEG